MKVPLFFLVGFSGFTAAAQITSGSFGSTVVFPAGDSPVQCALVDLQGDGKPDLMVANYLSSTIGVYRNQSLPRSISPGSFAPPIYLPTGSGPHQMAMADVDGDGRQDAVTGNLGNNTVSILRNTSVSNVISFAAKMDIPIPGQFVRNLAIGDLDGDGRNDIAVVAFQSDNLILLRNAGGPGNLSFDPPFVISNIGDGPHSVATADIDGDGRPDIIVGNFETPDLVVLRRVSASNPGRAFDETDFAAPIRFPRGGNALEVGDLDGDGRVDIAVGHWRTHGMALYRNVSSAGTIALETPVEFDVGNSIHSVAIRDIDADSKPELVMVGELPSFMSIYKNLSTPGSLTSSSFAPRVELPSGWNAIGVATGDIDGDTRPDITFANAYDDNLYVYQNRIGLPVPPFIVQQPQSQTVNLGGTAVFTVGVTGSPPFGFRWRHNGLTIVPFSQGTDTLVISNVQPSHAGSYDVIITNGFNLVLGVISARASLTVFDGTNHPPTITQQPDSQIVMGGSDVTFSVQAIGTEPLSYRWRRNNLSLPGATNPVLMLPSVTLSNNGFYSVLVSNIAGFLISSNAELRVVIPTNPPPATRLVSTASMWRYEQSGFDLGSVWAAPDYDDSAWASGPGLLGVEIAHLPEPINTALVLGPITYYFRHSFTVLPEHLNLPSSFRARLRLDDGAVVYLNGVEVLRVGMPPGAVTANTFAGRTVPDAVFEDGPFLLPRELFAVGANTLAVEVHQSAPFSSDIVFGMTLDVEFGPGDPVAPSITRHPSNQTVPPGATANFSVEATGTPPLSYQWHKDNSILPGATNRVLIISNVTSNDVGFYSVLVSNEGGSVMSTPGLLRLSTFPLAPPPMITSFSPQSGPVGTVVTITGMNFSPNPLANRVYFGAMRAHLTSGSSTTLMAEVPVGATFEPISVITSNRVAYSDRPFVVTFPSSRTIHPGSFEGFNLPTGDVPIHVAMGDMDRDGRLDFVVANHYSSTVSVYLNRGTNGALNPNFAPGPAYPTGPLPFHLALADLDGDGGLDVITANMGDHTISLLRNTPAGLFALAAPLHFPVGQLPDALATGDLDKDGRTDIVVANQDSDSITILRQLGNPFSPLTVVPFTRTDIPVGDGPHNLIVGDVDGDGRPDITVANYLTPSMALLRNLTAAPGIDSTSFAPPVVFPRGGNCLAFGDLDGDGRQDIAIGNWRSQTLSLFRNLSTPGSITGGSLAPPVDFSVGNNPHTIAISDLDGDARPDIALVGELDSYMSIFKNLGLPGALDHSSFGARVDFPSGWNAVGIAAGDLDGDSRPELVFANAYDDNITIYHNLTTVQPNQPPIARATAFPALDFLSDQATFVIIAPNTEALVVFDGSASSDPDGDTLVYQWSTDGTVFATGAVSSNLLSVGTYPVTLLVSDGLDAGSTIITVKVIPAESAIDALIIIVDESNLSRRTKRPIISALKLAAARLADDKTLKITRLQNVQDKINAQVAPADPALAALLNGALQEIIDALSAGP